MVANIPVGDNPTVDWFIEFLDQFFDLVENLVDSAIVLLLPSMRSAVLGFSSQVHALKERFVDLVTQVDELIKKYDNATLDTVVDLADKLFIATAATIFNTILAELQQIRRNVFVMVEKQLAREKLWIGDFGDKRNLTKYKQLWASLPLPEPASRLHDDTYFGYARVAGPNPMVLRKVTGALPDTLRLNVSRFTTAAGESAASALAAGRLFVCDYAVLGDMAKEDATFKVLTGANYNTAPIAVFVRPADSQYLTPVAIQIGQRPGHSPVFYAPKRNDPAAADYWGWQMAKTVVQTADFNHHEMFSHLAWTHLVSEAFCVAMHRQLPVGHPLRALLEPHFEGDLFINNLAASVIMGPETFADIILAPDIHLAQAGAGGARLNWNFTEQIPRNEFANRGVDDPNLAFPYRDDALLIFDDIHAWVTDYVNTYYRTDKDVTSDAELHNWLREARTKGKVKGIGAVESRARLAEVVAMIIFTASAQHAAVNYPQRSEMTYAPWFSGTLSAIVDSPERHYTELDWFNMMPTLLSAFAQMYFLNVLGSVYYRRLGDYRTNVFPFPKSLVDPKITGHLNAFRDALSATESTIVARNKSRRWPYSYLLPSKIPMSTNI